MASTVSIANGKTLTVNNSITLSGADGTSLDLGPWQPYSPNVSATVGSFSSLTVSASFKRIGNTVAFQVVIKINAIGTAAGSIVIPLPLPIAANAALVAVGRENATTGKMCQAYVGVGDVNMRMNFYDNTSPIADGYQFLVNGTYESA